MKSKKIWIAILAIISFITVGSSAIVNSVEPVKAETRMSMFPKKMRGTWYQYNKKTHRIDKNVITAKKWVSYSDGKKGTEYLHVYPKNAPAYPKQEKKKQNWIYILGDPVKVRGRMWILVEGWYQAAGGASYNVSKLKGHWVLTNASGAGLWYSNHWYHSAKLAKKLKNQRYPHFAYDSGAKW